MMLCAGGGTILDYAEIKYFSEFWPSDYTNAFDRIFIQWEYSYYFPSVAVDNHVTDMGKQPIKFKTDVAMMGKLGYDVKVNELDEKELLFSQNAVKTYNVIKDIIWHGQQYRLQDPYENKVAAISYVSETRDTAIIFNYYVSTLYNAKNSIPIKLKGLDPDKMYKIEEINLYPGTTSPIDSQRSYSGDFLMTVGINPEADVNRASVVLKAIAL